MADWEAKLLAGAPDKELGADVARAIHGLLSDDAALLVRDANERTITACLARHLSPIFEGWAIDCEYNRHGHAVKRIGARMVVPDIIIHQRGTPNNLLVIEVKKSNTKEHDDSDMHKLMLFRGAPLHYQHALFVKFRVDTDSPGVERVEWA